MSENNKIFFPDFWSRWHSWPERDQNNSWNLIEFTNNKEDLEDDLELEDEDSSESLMTEVIDELFEDAIEDFKTRVWELVKVDNSEVNSLTMDLWNEILVVAWTTIDTLDDLSEDKLFSFTKEYKRERILKNIYWYKERIVFMLYEKYLPNHKFTT